MDTREIRRINLHRLMDKRFGVGVRGAQSRLAELLGKPQNLISRYLAPPANPNSKTIGEDFARDVERAFGLQKNDLDSALLEVADASNVVPGPPITSAAKRIAIVGTAQMGPEGHWVALDSAGGWVEAWTRDDDAYALELRGDSMSPAIRNGWVAVCEPNHRLVPGEYVMVTTTDGESMVKELLFQTETGVSLMSLNSAYERRSLQWTEIDTIHYVAAIMGPSKVMGRI